MKYVALLFWIINSSFEVIAQPNIDSLLKYSEIGYSYAAINLNNQPITDLEYYAIIPPIFEMYIDTLDSEIENPYAKKISYLWEIRTIRTDSMLKNCVNHTNFILFDKIPYKEDYKIQVHKLTVSHANDSIFSYKEVLYKKYRKISDGNIIKLKTKDERIHSEQQVFVVEKGQWTDFRQALCPKEKTIDKIRKIQLALNKAGYPCEVDGNFDENTRKALIDFKKENCLSNSRFGDIECLRKLGLKD